MTFQGPTGFENRALVRLAGGHVGIGDCWFKSLFLLALFSPVIQRLFRSALSYVTCSSDVLRGTAFRWLRIVIPLRRGTAITLRIIWSLVVLAILAAATGGARAEGYSPSQVSAALILKIIQYVEWENSLEGTGAGDLVIAVAFDESLYATLAKFSQGRTKLGRRIVVRTLGRSVEEPVSAEVLVIGKNAELAALQAQGVFETRMLLTISTQNGFAESYGIIGIRPMAVKKITINPKRARSLGIRVSARLLQLSIIAE